MASELTVQTIKGPTSGGNANKILLGSGQNLIAPGHVVNVATESYITGNSVSPSTSYVNTATLGTITTVHANSKILIITDVPVQTQKQNTIWSVALRSSIDNYASDLVAKLRPPEPPHLLPMFHVA